MSACRLVLLVLATILVGIGPPSPSHAQTAAELAQQPVFDPGDQLGAVGRPWTGAREPNVVIVMFSEFQCPFCARAAPTMARLLEENDDVTLVFRHMPLAFHQNAEPAAVAAEAAFRQHAFWPYYDALFEEQSRLNTTLYLAAAQALDLDMDRFRADLDDPAVLQAVRDDVAAASRFGIRGTPNFLVNGRLVAGAQPYDVFAQTIADERAAVQALMDAGSSREEALGARIQSQLVVAQPAPRPSPAAAPDPDVRMFVDVSDRELRGADEPLVVIAEFGEYQCPFCGRVEPTLEQILDRWGDDVAVAFFHYPLAFHDQAAPAARAALAADLQGAFWPFHDALFADQRALGEARYREIAESLGLDADQLVADMYGQQVGAALAADDAERSRLSVSGTPHFFVNGRRLRGAQPFEEFEELIEQELAAAQALMDQGVDRADVYDTLMADAERGTAPPVQPTATAPAEPSTPTDIDITGAPTIGPDDAPVQFVVFSEFQCPYCSRFADTYGAVLPEYGADVQFVFMHMPLPMHQHADEAARAAQAAALQGAFEAYHDALFDHSRELSDGLYLELAEDLDLDVEQFERDMQSAAVGAIVEAHEDEAAAIGVRGTPTWFVNGVRYVGALDAASVRQAIDDALEAAE